MHRMVVRVLMEKEWSPSYAHVSVDKQAHCTDLHVATYRGVIRATLIQIPRSQIEHRAVRKLQ